jgi:CHAT domain-containing protein/Tfp pilus assembly protein PilF
VAVANWFSTARPITLLKIIGNGLRAARDLAPLLVAVTLVCGLTGSQTNTVQETVDKLMAEGRYAEAEPLLRHALEEADAQPNPDPKSVATMLENLLEIASNSSQFQNPADDALARRALAAVEEAHGAHSYQMALTLRHAGELAVHNEQFETARTYYKRALALHESPPVTQESLFQQGQVWNDLGYLMRRTFDLQGAKEAYQRSLALLEESVGHEHRTVGVGLNNLADTLDEFGDEAGAELRYREALRIYEKTVGPDDVLVAGCLNNLAALLTKTGHAAEAAELLRKVVRIAQAHYGEIHARTAASLFNLAGALSASGQFQSAATDYERVVDIDTAIYGPLNIHVAAALNGRALNLARRGDSAQAEELAIQAGDLERAYDLIAIRTMPEREALLYVGAKASGRRASGLNTLLSLAAAGAPGGPALNALIRSRAVVFDEIAARQRAAAGGDPETAKLARNLATARAELARLVVSGPKGVTAEQYGAAVDRANEGKRAAERLLAENSLPFRRELQSREVGLDQVAAALPDDAALISFVRYPRVPLRLKAPAADPAAQPVFSYLAIVLRPGQSQLAVVSLGVAAEVDDLVAQVRRTIAQEARDPGRAPAQSEHAYRLAAERLRIRIWDPLIPYWKGAKRVFLVPDGTLYGISFAALPAGRGYLVENGPLLHYLSAEREVAAPAAKASASGLLLVANPVFDSATMPSATRQPLRGTRTVCGAYRDLHFAALPGALREAADVASVWRQAGGEESSLAGSAARKSSVLEQAAGKLVLHFATHGFFLDSCDTAMTKMPSSSTQNAENPLLLSGLALAGANDRKQPGEGILTAEEIASTNLEGVEWAVLSACDSGLGEIQAGEGLFGLRRAFQLAGARTVIASLWPADDASTNRWMRELYRSRFLEGRSTAEAVSHASLSLLAYRRAAHLGTHPLYWAGFVAVGDWR